LVERLIPVAIPVLSSDLPSLPIADFLYFAVAHFPSLSTGELSLFPSLLAMQTAAKKCTLSVSVSLALSVSISELALAPPVQRTIIYTRLCLGSNQQRGASVSAVARSAVPRPASSASLPRDDGAAGTRIR
jgi:hypothetical protein